jgi:hypothetical protein
MKLAIADIPLPPIPEKNIFAIGLFIVRQMKNKEQRVKRIYIPLYSAKLVIIFVNYP